MSATTQIGKASKATPSRPIAHRVESTLRSHTQAVLRSAILNGKFEAGQKLVERELCEVTGASRSVLREALVNLEVNGLIERQSYCGYRVTKLDARTVCEIFELRSSLETQAAELFAERASESELQSLNEEVSALASCVENFDLETMRVVKERYYDILFIGCRNRELRRALENIIDRVSYLRSRLMLDPDRRQASLNEMRTMTAALLKRDRMATRAASLAHLAAAREAVLLSMSDEKCN
ncbi:MAG: FCD domain-containing protein [Gammaproteobacteria bacterium]|nr:FCD domain-containing protein [Gammaproteobacteria bacterium]